MNSSLCFQVLQKELVDIETWAMSFTPFWPNYSGFSGLRPEKIKAKFLYCGGRTV